MNLLNDQDLKLTNDASAKMAELFSQIEENIEGIRVYAQAGGCSGVNFGMTFAEKVDADDLILEKEGIKVIVDPNTITHLRGAEIGFETRDDGQPSFVFNNLPEQAGGGCGTCSSKGCG